MKTEIDRVIRVLLGSTDIEEAVLREMRDDSLEIGMGKVWDTDYTLILFSHVQVDRKTVDWSVHASLRLVTNGRKRFIDTFQASQLPFDLVRDVHHRLPEIMNVVTEKFPLKGAIDRILREDQ